ncbi:MAG: hypothetical protein ABSG64_10260 [Solirubrobacteraceae bacterium]|jgi:hypothetical protein
MRWTDARLRPITPLMAQFLTCRRSTAAVLAVVCAVLAGCGTPAVIKAGKPALPGFQHDIQAAHNVAKELQNPQVGATP